MIVKPAVLSVAVSLSLGACAAWRGPRVAEMNAGEHEEAAQRDRAAAR